MITIKFGERVKELREEREISQEKLAKVLNVSRVTISYWENGTQETNFLTLALCAQYFKVTVDYLLGLDNYR